MTKKKEYPVTIRAPKAILKKWDTFLTSGEFRQTTEGTLFDEKRGSFCCLGLLQYAVSGGKVEHNGQEYEQMPSYEWLRANGITFHDSCGRNNNSPYLPTLGGSADEVNDRGSKFETIARAIRVCSEGY